MANMDSVKIKELADLLGIKMANMEKLWYRGYSKPELLRDMDILDLIEIIGFKESRIAQPKIEKAFKDGAVDEAVQAHEEEKAKWQMPGLGGLFAKAKSLKKKEEEPGEEPKKVKIKEKSGLGLNKLKAGFPLRKKEEPADGEVKEKKGLGLKLKDKLPARKKEDADKEPEAEQEPKQEVAEEENTEDEVPDPEKDAPVEEEKEKKEEHPEPEDEPAHKKEDKKEPKKKDKDSEPKEGEDVPKKTVKSTE